MSQQSLFLFKSQITALKQEIDYLSTLTDNSRSKICIHIGCNYREGYIKFTCYGDLD